MIKFYTFTLGKKGKTLKKEGNRSVWFGFENNYDIAVKKAKKHFPGFEITWYTEMTLLECLYLLPFFDRRQK